MAKGPQIVYIVYHDNMFSIGAEAVFTKRGSALSFARRMNKKKDGNRYVIANQGLKVLTKDSKSIVKREERFEMN